MLWANAACANNMEKTVIAKQRTKDRRTGELRVKVENNAEKRAMKASTGNGLLLRSLGLDPMDAKHLLDVVPLIKSRRSVHFWENKDAK